MSLILKEVFLRSLPLLGDRVELRLFCKEHITNQYLNWLNNKEIMRYSNQRFKFHDEISSQAYLKSFENTENILLAIYLANTDRFVGTMTVYFSIPHETADIGILIGDKSMWGQGIGKDAWTTLMSFLMDTGLVRKITGGALRCNVGMVNLMVNSNMQPDGVRFGQELFEGLPQDILYFACYRNE